MEVEEKARLFTLSMGLRPYGGNMEPLGKPKLGAMGSVRIHSQMRTRPRGRVQRNSSAGNEEEEGTKKRLSREGKRTWINASGRRRIAEGSIRSTRCCRVSACSAAGQGF